MHFIKKYSKQLLLAHVGNARILFRSNSTVPISVRLYETAMITPSLCFMIAFLKMFLSHLLCLLLQNDMMCVSCPQHQLPPLLEQRSFHPRLMEQLQQLELPQSAAAHKPPLIPRLMEQLQQLELSQSAAAHNPPIIPQVMEQLPHQSS